MVTTLLLVDDHAGVRSRARALLEAEGFDLGIVILAYVLGPIFERSVRQALAISDGDPSIFLHSKLSTGFAIVAVVLLVAGLWPKKRRVATS